MAIKKIALRYSEMLESGQVLSNRHAISIMDERITQLLERIDVEEAPARVKNLYALWQDLKSAKRRKDQNAIVHLEKQIDAEFEKAYHDYAAWEQMFEIFDIRRKHVEGEVKMIKEMEAILTAEQAYALVAKLMNVCIRHVRDVKVLRRINADFSRIIGENDLREPADIVEVEAEEDDDDHEPE